MAAREEITVENVRLTSPEKVLYPEQGTTKRDLADYYLAVADWMLPHVANRPITLVRCPTGRQKKCFYQRHAGSGAPEELSEVDIAGFEDSGAYLYIRDAKGLVALVQMGVLEFIRGTRASTAPTGPTASSSISTPARGSASPMSGALPTRSAHDCPTSVSSASPRRRAARACMSSRRSCADTNGGPSKPSPSGPPRRWPPMRLKDS